MVRLEKVLWEQLVNIKQLNRNRVIGSPRKWFDENRHDAGKVVAHQIYNKGITAAIFRVLEPLMARFTYTWMRNIALSRGLSLEDFLLFQDRQLRREYMFEMQARQNLHPYTWIFFKRRRARFYKVERAVRGFSVPQWARKDAEERTLADMLENKETWENFNYKETMSELTPTGRWSILSKWNPLDMFLWHGLWRSDAWDRLFYNESSTGNHTKADLLEATSNPFNANLSSPDGRKRFEESVERFQKLYPAAITKVGEKFDFKRFYVEHAIATGQDVSQYDQNLVSQLKSRLIEDVVFRKDKLGDKSGKKIGTTAPDFLQPLPGKAFF